MTSMHDAAMAWYDAGMAVIPARADGSKRPVHEWKKFQGERPARHLVEGWYKSKPEWGVGIVCGQASGNLEMLEIEAVRMFGEWPHKVDDIMAGHGLDELWDMLSCSGYGYCEVTPSGGIHILYRISDMPVPGNTKIAMSEDSQTTYAETRGEGGFVIVAPTSGTVHPSGESWTVLFGEIGTVPTITWEQRCAIHAALKEALDERVLPVYERPVGLTYDRSRGDRPGDAFNDDPNVTIGDVLLRNGWKFLGMKQGQEEYVHPRSSDMTTGSARTGYKGLPGLYAWSGMPHEGSFDKFSILTHLEFNGDFSACSRYLRRQGYGSTTWAEDDGELIDMSDFPSAEKAVQAVPEALAGSSTLVEQPDYRLSEYSHVGVAKVLRKAIGAEFRSVSEEKMWRVYSAGRWMADRENALPQRMEKITAKLRDDCDAVLAQAQETGDKEQIMAARKVASFGASLRSSRGIADVMNVFGQQKGVSTSANRFDVDTNLLVMTNGTFELDTMTLREHRPQDMLTKCLDVAYDPDAVAPRWDKFLVEAVPDEGTRRFLQRAVGMTALGTTQEGAMFILHGPSGCGKSTFLEVVAGVFGEYAASTPSSTFAAARNGREKGTADLHSLMGVRFASLSETDRGARLDESLVKSVTGGDRVTSRALYQDFVTWKPQFTLWMATNHLPSISFDDDAIWRRLKPVEFPNSFTTGLRERELNLANRILATEKAGVLNWVLEGVRAYLTEGFDQPDTIAEAVKTYQTDSDPVSTFLVEATDEGRIEQGNGFDIKSSELYRIYVAWCSDNALRPLSDRSFGRRLTDLGFPARKGTAGVRMRSGVRMNAAFGPASAQKAASERWW